MYGSDETPHERVGEHGDMYWSCIEVMRPPHERVGGHDDMHRPCMEAMRLLMKGFGEYSDMYWPCMEASKASNYATVTLHLMSHLLPLHS